MRRPNGVSFTPWSFCERCMFLYPLHKLVVQNGLRVCTLYCYDNDDIEYRPMVIQQVLGDGAKEGMPVTPEIYDTPEEILF